MATQQPTRAERGILIYDGDCAFCTTSVRWLEEHLASPPQISPYQELDLDRFGLTEQDCARHIWLISGDRHYAGYLALAALLKHQPGLGTRYLGHLSDTAPFSWGFGLVYSVVARNRHRLPGGTPACQLKLPS